MVDFRQTCGIDPGLKGAIAIRDTPSTVIAMRLPTERVQIGKSKRPRLIAQSVLDLIQPLSLLGVALVVLEKPFGKNGQSASAAVTYGEACGLIRMAVVASCIPHMRVEPSLWKKALGCPKHRKTKERKELTRQFATSLFPACAHQWPNEADHDIAEAALIAEYGQRILSQCLDHAKPNATPTPKKSKPARRSNK